MVTRIAATDYLLSQPSLSLDLASLPPSVILEVAPSSQDQPSDGRLNELRTKLISANFAETQPRVHSLGTLNRTQIPAISTWEMCKQCVFQMHRERVLWKVVAALIVVVAGAVLLCYLAKLSIATTLQRIAQGGWYVESYINGVYVGRHPLSMGDVVGEAFLWICGLISLGIISCIGLSQQPFMQRACVLFQNVKQASTPRVAFIQTLKTDPSSGEKLATETDPNEVLAEVFSQQDLKPEDIQKPRYIVIRKYAAEIIPLMHRISERRSLVPGKIPHPFENRDMDEHEQTKFLSDVSKFFCIKGTETVMQCFDIGSPQFRRYMFILNLPSQIRSIHCRNWSVGYI